MHRALGSTAPGQTFVAADVDIHRTTRCHRRLRIATAAVISAALVVAGSTARAHTKTTQVTWVVDVAPILEARCVKCHQAGGFGPMSLGAYDEARTWAAGIRDEVLSGRMPPWSAMPGFGDFANDASLSNVEIELLAKWAEGGAPRGPDAPAAPATAKPPRGDRRRVDRFELPAVRVSGASVETVSRSTAFAADRWITGWQFEPGIRSLVEEAVVSIAGTAIGAWTPFDKDIIYSSGTGERLPKGAVVTVAVRYRRSTESSIDRSTLTLYFGRKPARELRHLAVGCGVRAVDREMALIAVTPRATAAGATIELAAYRPDGAVAPLCVVSHYRPQYPVAYRLRRPVRLARGSRIEIRSSSPGCTAMLDYVTP